jgi:hypothetical protein
MAGIQCQELLSQNARSVTEKAQDLRRMLWISKWKDANYAVDGKWNTTNVERVNNENT